MFLKVNSRVHIICVLYCVLFIFFFSCNYIDVGGLFVSSNVNDRFKAKDSLSNYTRPDLSDDNNYSFLVVADLHYYDTQPNYFKVIEDNKNAWGISFVVVIGDIAQNGLSSAYDLALNDMKQCTLPIYSLIGNHDLYNNGFDIYKNKLGRTVYDFRIASSHFIFLDTANGTLGKLQTDWLEDTLKNSSSTNKFIFSHYSPVDSEWLDYCDWSYPEEKYHLFDLFDKYDVNYYLCGHLHHNDSAEIRGVKYITIKNLSSHENKVYLKITVNNNTITDELF